MTKILYRVEEMTYSAGVDEYGGPIPGGPTRTNLITVPILKRTPCGYWIPDYRSGVVSPCMRRWICKHRTLPFACETVEDAVKVYRRRKAAHLRILRKRVECIEEALRYLDANGFYPDEREFGFADEMSLV